MEKMRVMPHPTIFAIACLVWLAPSPLTPS